MKKLIITLLTICIVFFGFAFLILFEASTDNALKWWASYSRNSPSLPYSPYKIRREDSAFLRMEEANSVKFIDKHIFWKGTGAVCPRLPKGESHACPCSQMAVLTKKRGGTPPRLCMSLVFVFCQLW